MFDTIALIMFGIAIVLFIMLAYTILCCADMHKKFKNGNSSSIVKKYTWNLFLDVLIIVYKKFIVGATAGLAGASEKLTMTSLKAVYKKIKKVAYGSAVVYLLISVISIIIGIQLLQVNEAMKTVATSIQSIFGDDDCTCYALCTNNPEDDQKCTYELIFGPDEYQRLLNDMVLTPEEQEKFDSLELACQEFNKNYSKESGEHIIPYINETMVSDYKQAIGNNSKFMSHDGKDRTKMTNDELKADLIKLLSDYKQNGRNPNCKCYEYSGTKLERKCNGEKHWTKGWEWEEIPDGTTPSPGPGPSPEPPEPSPDDWVPGHATGPYAVDLDDGSYFWYHQNGGHVDNCVNCGDWSDRIWGNSSQVAKAGCNTFGRDGCAIYSLAIGVSNLTGREITPTVVLQDFGCAISGNVCDTTPSSLFNGRSLSSRQNAVSTLANKYGLTYREVGHNISEIDAVLDEGGYVWGSWYDSQCQWCGNGTSHFMCIRKKDGDNYYCFTSCRGKCASTGGKAGAIQTMNYPLNKSECIGAMVNKPLFGLIGPKGSTPGPSPEPIPPVPGDVLSRLKNSMYASKAEALAGVYGCIEPKYGSSAAIGIMANVWHEGTPGVVQFGKTVPNWDGNGNPGKSTNDSPLYIRQAVNVDAMEALYGEHNPKDIGFGIIQWTYYTYLPTLARHYRAVCTTEPYSNSSLLSAELNMLLDTVKGKESYLQGDHVKVCENFLLYIERPSGASGKVSQRCATAQGIYEVLTK